MRILFLDCFSGISGDMTVGALADLGVSHALFESALAALDPGHFHMHFRRESRQSIEGTRFDIHEGHTHALAPAKHSHPHGHEHAHGRTHGDIRTMIEQSALSDFVKKRALAIFRRIAVAEGKIHGQAPEDVTFHEVGALDSIADIVCACAGIEALQVERIFVSHLRDGSGWIDCAHGKFPVPSTATLEILHGIPVGQIDEPFEFITPTGAAIVAEFGEGFGPMPRLKPERIGYGIGSRDLASRPNVLRAVLGELDSAETADTVGRIETNLDDISPELVGAAMDKLFAAGALDVFLTPIQMKKNRPAVQLSVLCEEADIPRMAGIIFAETTAFGVRTGLVDRLKLERSFDTVETPFGEVRMKLGFRAGKLIQVAPEFDSCRDLSARSGEPVRVIYEHALSCYRAKSAPSA